MKYLNIIAEGSSEESFVNDVLVKHFDTLNIFVSTRKIRTGWDKLSNKPAKGGLLKYSKFKYSPQIQQIHNPYVRINELEMAISKSINNANFIPYVQLHEFESLLLVAPERLLVMYPEKQSAVEKLKRDIENITPEEINESQQTAPSKRIIKYLPDYEDQKAQVGALVAGDIGITEIRNKCPHFNEWITRLEKL